MVLALDLLTGLLEKEEEEEEEEGVGRWVGEMGSGIVASSVLGEVWERVEVGGLPALEGRLGRAVVGLLVGVGKVGLGGDRGGKAQQQHTMNDLSSISSSSSSSLPIFHAPSLLLPPLLSVLAHGPPDLLLLSSSFFTALASHPPTHLLQQQAVTQALPLLIQRYVLFCLMWVGGWVGGWVDGSDVQHVCLGFSRRRRNRRMDSND